MFRYQSLKRVQMLRPMYLPQTVSRSFSKLTVVDVDNKTGVACLGLNSPPVNSLNLELLTDITVSIKEIIKSGCKGLILTSKSDHVFSSGLDINEMVNPQKDRLETFWRSLQDCWLALYGCPLPTVALLNGHSPAGGCLLACSCEYRVMLPGYTIGLNESKLGIVAPYWFMTTFMNVLPRRIAELALTQGKMFTSEEAAKSGLVDQISSNKDEALIECIKFIKTFQKVDMNARSAAKVLFRSFEIKNMIQNRDQDVEDFINFITEPRVQRKLNNYFLNLKQNKKK